MDFADAASEPNRPITFRHRRDGVRLPRRQLARVGDVTEDLGNRAPDAAFDREVDQVTARRSGRARSAHRGACRHSHASWSRPRTLPSGSVMVATKRPPPTSCGGSLTVAPAAVTSASFASMSPTCQYATGEVMP